MVLLLSQSWLLAILEYLAIAMEEMRFCLFIIKVNFFVETIIEFIN